MDNEVRVFRILGSTLSLILLLLYLFIIFMLFASKFKFLPTFYNKVMKSNAIWWILFISLLLLLLIVFIVGMVVDDRISYYGISLIIYLIIPFLLSCFMLFGPKIKALQSLYSKVNNRFSNRFKIRININFD